MYKFKDDANKLQRRTFIILGNPNVGKEIYFYNFSTILNITI